MNHEEEIVELLSKEETSIREELKRRIEKLKFDNPTLSQAYYLSYYAKVSEDIIYMLMVYMLVQDNQDQAKMIDDIQQLLNQKEGGE